MREGHRVLIHAGAGGVGSFGVQLAKARGAHVITTAGPRNIDFVKQVQSWLWPAYRRMASRADLPYFLSASAHPCKSSPCSLSQGSISETLFVTIPAMDLSSAQVQFMNTA